MNSSYPMNENQMYSLFSASNFYNKVLKRFERFWKCFHVRFFFNVSRDYLFWDDWKVVKNCSNLSLWIWLHLEVFQIFHRWEEICFRCECVGQYFHILFCQVNVASSFQIQIFPSLKMTYDQRWCLANLTSFHESV